MGSLCVSPCFTYIIISTSGPNGLSAIGALECFNSVLLGCRMHSKHMLGEYLVHIHGNSQIFGCATKLFVFLTTLRLHLCRPGSVHACM